MTSQLTNDEVSSQCRFVGGQAPDSQVVNGHDSFNRVERLLHDGEADVSRNSWSENNERLF